MQRRILKYMAASSLIATALATLFYYSFLCFAVGDEIHFTAEPVERIVQDEISLALYLTAGGAAIIGTILLLSRFLSSRIVCPLESISVTETDSPLNTKIAADYPELEPLIRRIETREEEYRQFTSNVSHEMKTPIANILNHSAIIANLAQSSNNSQLERSVRFVTAQSKRAAQMVDNVLHLARFDKHSGQLERTYFSARGLIEETAQEFSAQIQAKRIEFKIAADPQAKMFADRELIKQALRNLLENATKYCERQITAEFTARATPEATFYRLAVRNDGPAIPPADLSRVFERFFRAGNNSSENTSGQGIGLSIVKRIAELSGGKAQVRTLSDAKTEFSLTACVEHGAEK